MTIELKDVEHLAGLARIAVSEDEKKILQHDLEEILAYVSQVKDADSRGTDAEERRTGDLYNVMREDSEPHNAGVFTEDILSQAPTREGNRISVKKIL
ncbi:MAG: Asp-tRNA(Asn)/Glu-tRNA(Gln) amidotransferase subunit GatC [Candidatus Yonathbacteria bacterium]|nr:Asp-tRNA(Asn)/Glu-tRNA(Gln) amidotransferase subunit GatC [Candidatus Yonathbacteria bacterium]